MKQVGGVKKEDGEDWEEMKATFWHFLPNTFSMP